MNIATPIPRLWPALTWTGRYRPAEPPGRDLRLDLLRGWCIFSMVVDHAAGDRHSVLFNVTGNGTWPLTGAHGFVFLSGTVMALLYRDILASDGTRGVLRKALLRSLKLYLVAVGLGAFGILWGATSWGGGNSLADVSGRDLIGLATLTAGSDDLITFYLQLVVLAPILLWLMARGLTPLVALGSLGAWLTHFTHEEWLHTPFVSFVPVVDWQVLFVGGLVTGYHHRDIAGWMVGRRRLVYGALLGSTLVFFLVLQVQQATDRLGDAPAFIQAAADQAWQGYEHNPPLHFLAVLTYMLAFYHLVDLLWTPVHALMGWFLIPLGQAALYVYIVHTVVVYYLLDAILPGFKSLQGPALTATLLALMLLLWALVKRRFLFWLIPR